MSIQQAHPYDEGKLTRTESLCFCDDETLNNSDSSKGALVSFPKNDNDKILS